MMDKSLPPPPLPPKSRNDSLGAQLPTYRERPKPAGGFAAAKSLFENSAVQNAVFSAAKNPAVRSAAVSAAQNPATRNAAISAARNPTVRNAAMSSMASQPPKPPLGPKPQFDSSVDSDIQQKKVASLVKELDHFYQKQTTPPRPTHTQTLYPTLPDESSFNSMPFIPTPTRTTSISTSQTFDNSLISSVRSSSVQPDYLSSSYSAQQELDDLFGNISSKKAPPVRPPPPKFSNSHSHPNLNTLGRNTASPNILEPHAIVKYPYKAAHKDELTCQPDDVVLLQREVDEQWVYAANTRSGQRGIVPVSFLNVKVPLVPENKSAGPGFSLGPLTTSFDGLSMSAPKKFSVRMAKALYDYDSPIQGDLQFFAGDLITVFEQIDAEWCKGEVRGRTGIFPVNFVEISNATTPLASPCLSSPGAIGLGTVTAAYDYSSGVSEDLTFQAGDVIEIVERINDEWIRGRIGAREGMVPLTFVAQN
ncbi:hypothetical protein QR680_012139 [Steinernema hermaphroditum]|uniref:SH3 domain-containing protein n=1 Tax=Steinernema hermaphroditum TaxID=289476 RepID=A0AA39I107_9BILA|nr:hypothetical protein QR680_012139 [Steinernema hermaphroditum]